jgi:hypothetical protein
VWKQDVLDVVGRVVFRSDRNRGVPRAKILGIPDNAQTRYVSAICDEQGNFLISVHAETPLILAQNDDHSLSGIAPIRSDGQNVIVPIGPPSSAHGRLIEQATGKPAAKREINYWLVVDGRKFSLPGGGKMLFCGTTTTSPTGEFALAPLAPGWKYQIESGPIYAGREILYVLQDSKTLTEFTAPESGTIEVGEVKVPRTPTGDILAETAMRHPGPVDDLLKSKLEHARFADQRVLIVAGAPSNALCRLIFDDPSNAPATVSAIITPLGEKTGENPIAPALGNYAVLGLDLSDPGFAAKNEAFLVAHRLPVPPRGDAIIAVLDVDGHLIRPATATQLREGNQLSTHLIAWLQQYAAPLPDGEKLVETALAQAKAQNKRVLLRESAPRCDDCERLSGYLDKYRGLLEKEYVFVKLDARFPHADREFQSIQYSRSGGVPSIAILDAKGKTLVDSNSPQGNIGFPTSAQDVSYFEWMLRSTAQRLTDGDIATLVNALSKPKR